MLIFISKQEHLQVTNHNNMTNVYIYLKPIRTDRLFQL
jgi:hypothetical protein